MIMEREGLSAGAFAESIGVAQGTISHILSSRNKYPSTDVVLRLHQRYSDINLDWLLTGQGEMSTGQVAVVSSPEADEDDSAYPLFADRPEFQSDGVLPNENRRENRDKMSVNKGKEIVEQEIVYKERPSRKITEIRIFFDDNTYETFKPEK